MSLTSARSWVTEHFMLQRTTGVACRVRAGHCSYQPGKGTCTAGDSSVALMPKYSLTDLDSRIHSRDLEPAGP